MNKIIAILGFLLVSMKAYAFVPNDNDRYLSLASVALSATILEQYETVNWTNQETGNHGTVTVLSIFQKDDMNCKEISVGLDGYQSESHIICYMEYNNWLIDNNFRMIVEANANGQCAEVRYVYYDEPRISGGNNFCKNDQQWININ